MEAHSLDRARLGVAGRRRMAFFDEQHFSRTLVADHDDPTLLYEVYSASLWDMVRSPPP